MQGRLQSIESCRPCHAQGISVAGRRVAGNPPRREIHRAKLISLFCCFAFFNLGPGATVDRDLADEKAFSSNDVRPYAGQRRATCPSFYAVRSIGWLDAFQYATGTSSRMSNLFRPLNRTVHSKANVFSE
jgi:hypothetical protein